MVIGGRFAATNDSASLSCPLAHPIGSWASEIHSHIVLHTSETPLRIGHFVGI